ncbi:Biopolymer transport protein ExbD [Paraurantiacibacter namhicola]|uniref:Biopolymer transport protein ExbD n=2 Tax=Paraurantiacibacter namhicola TaxID=645517 RepID=A0A1C7D7G7_9SPHN|nr:Biopolymer transport protein ExbD [Paraurantiacibacter namhicola]
MGLASSARRGRGRASRRAPMAEINVTPFVDVMLVLLIIFMVTAPLLTAGVPVELPESRANPLDAEPEQVTISIDREGFIYIDSEVVEVGGFPEALEGLSRAAGEPPVVTLRADQALDYGRVMAVMGELNRAGFNSISLVTSGSSVEP